MIRKLYDVLFIDLDDTLYDFTSNSTDAYREVYAFMEYGRWFRSFEHYYEIYWARNRELWVLYADNKIIKNKASLRNSHSQREPKETQQLNVI